MKRTIDALLFMSGVLIYYGLSNYIARQTTTENFAAGTAVWVLCVMLFLWSRHRAESREETTKQAHNALVLLATLAGLF